MTRRTNTIDPSYFEALYAEHVDPWSFASSAYEQAKYEHTLAALPQPRYARALEVGCSIGVFTRALAQRCESLLAVDAAETCLAEARRRCEGSPNVSFARQFVPNEWPEGEFDLIVLSEVVYYLDPADVVRLARRIESSLAALGTVALAHWTGLTDYPLAGDEAAELFITALLDRVEILVEERRSEYRLDVLVRRPA